MICRPVLHLSMEPEGALLNLQLLSSRLKDPQLPRCSAHHSSGTTLGAEPPFDLSDSMPKLFETVQQLRTSH